MLPRSVADRLSRWDRQRQARGKPPLAWPLRLRSDTIGGIVMLRCLAALKAVRRHGARYAREHADIERWLDAIVEAAGVDWTLANEIALCGRLVKGYGATNERGKQNLSHILDHLANAGAAAVREAREAALADEAGKSFDETMTRHGAPALPAVARPIVWASRQRAVPRATR